MSETMEQKGRIVLDLKPGANNPRNSEGAFLDMEDGRLLFAYSRYSGESGADDGKACIASRYSSDNGETWTGDIIIVEPEEYGVCNIMSVSLLRMSNNDVGLFYLIRYGVHDLRIHLRRSSDEGNTWGSAICSIPARGCYVTNNDRIVRLSSGRIIIPAAFHKMCGESECNFSSMDIHGITHFFLSDDDGVTWREAKNFCALQSRHSGSGLQEPGLIELRNGTLWAWARTDLDRQYEMTSTDCGETWTVPEPSRFSSPCSPLSMKRMPNDNLLAVWNPIPAYDMGPLTRNWPEQRTPLIAALSKDEGVTWDRYFYIEPGANGGGYCYTAIHFSKDSLFLAYCAGDKDDDCCLFRLKIRKIQLSDV